jgi:hypothetical protein
MVKFRDDFSYTFQESVELGQCLIDYEIDLKLRDPNLDCGRDMAVRHSVQTIFGAHPSSHSAGTGVESWPYLSSAAIKNW